MAEREVVMVDDCSRGEAEQRRPDWKEDGGTAGMIFVGAWVGKVVYKEVVKVS